jgi:PPOX class probable F420-dependent enzyme
MAETKPTLDYERDADNGLIAESTWRASTSSRRREPIALTFAEVAKAKHILLTTFTKDGRPKPTVVGAVPEGDRLLVITEEKSWKVKRIRNTPRVTVAICTARGRPKSEPVEAVAKILDKSAAPKVFRTLHQRYGVTGWLVNQYTKFRGRYGKYIPIELTATDPDSQ